MPFEIGVLDFREVAALERIGTDLHVHAKRLPFEAVFPCGAVGLRAGRRIRFAGAFRAEAMSAPRRLGRTSGKLHLRRRP